MLLNTHSKINIAIDGPAGAGKSTVAREVAKRLHYIYVDTGAMYRAVTWKALRNGLEPSQTREIGKLASTILIQLKPQSDGQHVLIDGEDVTSLLRTQQVNRTVSQIASIKEVRSKLVEIQQGLSKQKGVVMDGRDIGSHVIPDAEVKIYLTASVEERARRRYKEMISQHPENPIDIAKLQKEIQMRDEMDKTREISPLIIPEDAVIIDSTNMSFDRVVNQILLICRKQLVTTGD